ncbi:hypothetical protein J4N42_22030 [Vibrio sp. SCSIO 43135]|uniref:hypothetical protein n=1 Tax=Vibrio sp. SCSIO 43135 TaxID=2819096 RepID=UPI0020760A7C|nr:hypothetical protein [Vibrio sp. SCSIO 43135]USD43271.1 hypothetical protein J4N42_22030 [Vibrio sp. SCSIO 43135]
MGFNIALKPYLLVSTGDLAMRIPRDWASLFALTALASPLAFASFDNIDFDVQLSQYEDQYVGTVGVNYGFTNNLQGSVSLDSDLYTELGLSYGKAVGDKYFEGYGRFGFDDTIDIYDLGGLAGKALSHQTFVYWDSYLQLRSPKADFNIPPLSGDNPEDTDRPISQLYDNQIEWKNSIAVDYTPVDWLSLGMSYNFDVLLTEHHYEDSLRDSVDVSASFNLPYVTPYIKYTHGEYRARPQQPVPSESYAEIGIYFNF